MSDHFSDDDWKDDLTEIVYQMRKIFAILDAIKKNQEELKNGKMAREVKNE
jgi:hypothetical protein